MKEPVVTVASITAGVTAILALLVAFGLPLTGDQQTAILAVVAVVAPPVVALIARRLVTPTSRVAAQVDAKSGVVVAGPAAAESDGTPVTVTLAA